MLVLFAKNDINEENLKVRAGHPLPSRFQQSTLFTLSSLRKHLGPDAVIPFTEDTQGYVLVETSRIAALETENALLKQQLADRPKDKRADKKETQ